MRFPLLAIALVLAAGCVSITGPDWITEVGTLPPEEVILNPVEVPASARVGRSFTVRLTTAGAHGCTEARATSIRVTDLVADMVPLDNRYVGTARDCESDITPRTRFVSVTFHAAGRGVVRVSAFRKGADGGSRLVTIEREIAVSP